MQSPHRDVDSTDGLERFRSHRWSEVGSFFDTSALCHTSAKMREYKGELSDLMVQKIPPALVGNEIGKLGCTVWTGARL